MPTSPRRLSMKSTIAERESLSRITSTLSWMTMSPVAAANPRFAAAASPRFVLLRRRTTFRARGSSGTASNTGSVDASSTTTTSDSTGSAAASDSKNVPR